MYVKRATLHYSRVRKSTCSPTARIEHNALESAMKGEKPSRSYFCSQLRSVRSTRLLRSGFYYYAVPPSALVIYCNLHCNL